MWKSRQRRGVRWEALKRDTAVCAEDALEIRRCWMRTTAVSPRQGCPCLSATRTPGRFATAALDLLFECHAPISSGIKSPHGVLSHSPMRTTFLPIALLALTITGLAAVDSVSPSGERKQAVARWSPIGLGASDLSIATGQPSQVLMSNGSTHIPVWSLSGGTVGQSVAGLLTGLPSECAAVKVEIVVTTTEAATSPNLSDAYRVHLSQMIEGAPFTER